MFVFKKKKKKKKKQQQKKQTNKKKTAILRLPYCIDLKRTSVKDVTPST